MKQRAVGILAIATALSIASAASASESVYVANYDNNAAGGISQFTIGSDGTLSPDSPPLATADLGPLALVISPDGKHAYAANNGNADVSQYTVGSGGQLTPDATPTIAAGPAPIAMAISPNGQYVYVLNNGGTLESISQYTVAADGTLVSAGTTTLGSGSDATSIVVSPDGKYVYVADNIQGSGVDGTAAHGISQFTIGAGGALTPDSTPYVTTGSESFGLAITPNGQYLYVTNADTSGSNPTSNSIWEYSIGSDGELTRVGTQVATGSEPEVIAVSPNGQYAYVVNYAASVSAGVSAQGVSQYTIGSGGQLSPESPATVSGGDGPEAVAVSPDSRYVYVANFGNVGPANTVTEYAVGTGGTLSQVGTVNVGTYPYWVAVAPDPGPSAGFTSQLAAAGSSSAFTSTATSANYAVASESWSFGDGATASGTSVSHTYATPGTYTVTLAVIDAAGCGLGEPFFSGQAGPFTGTDPTCSPDSQAVSSQSVTIAAPPPPPPPPPSFTIVSIKHGPHGRVRVTLDPTAAGSFDVLVTHSTGKLEHTALLSPGASRSAYGSVVAPVAAGGEVTVTLKPTKFAARLLRDGYLHHHPKLQISVRYTPTTGYPVFEGRSFRW